jgi:hypothetical protein
MKRLFVCAAILAAGLAGMTGCNPESTTDRDDTNVYADGQEGKDEHDHEHADKLVWVKKDVENSGFTISLGQHGDHFHIGDMIEPAATIQKDGQDVADAEVYNSLVSSDGATVLVEEVKTVYEPKTADEPAHYAQGGLKIPEGAQKFLIRFRIKLPGVEQEQTLEIEGSAH